MLMPIAMQEPAKETAVKEPTAEPQRKSARRGYRLVGENEGQDGCVEPPASVPSNSGRTASVPDQSRPA
jgi:hypothetical protein